MLLGGLSHTDSSHSVNGWPGLAQLGGGVGYLFGKKSISLGDQELLILITPVRLRGAGNRKSEATYAGRGHNQMPSEHNSPESDPPLAAPSQAPEVPPSPVPPQPLVPESQPPQP